jgi:hypothetical protein
LWLDRLDVGLDDLPSDMLDSLVPEEPPAKARKNQQQAQECWQQQPGLDSVHGKTALGCDKPESMPVQDGMICYKPGPQMMHFTFQQPVPVNVCPMPLDVDSYVPRSLQTTDPVVREQLLQSRREKLERFREKKRNMHFKKTIRYASRKAYAEVRPRIKGRFARKDEVAAMRAAGVLPVA